MILAAVTFVLFALLSAAGVYWVAARERGHGCAVPAALATLLAFAALAWAVGRLLQQGLG